MKPVAKLLNIRSKRKLTQVLLSLLIGLAIYALNSNGQLSAPTKLVEKSQPGLYQVSEFIDGDTIAVNMGGTNEKVRMIGVDTPETHDPRKAVQCFGKAAAAYTKATIGSNRVRLEADPDNTNRDRYDRLLRYVYLPDGRLLNALLIQNGYGFAYVGFPFTKQAEFENYQRQAREANKGLWGGCQPTKNFFGGYTSSDASGNN